MLKLSLIIAAIMFSILTWATANVCSYNYVLKKKSNKDYEVLELLEDIVRDLNNYDLEFRIQELESKFSKDLSETTFNELKELKKKQNIN